MKQVEETTFYTDGACSGNPGAGGWAYVEVRREGLDLKVNRGFGGARDTTNNVMELTAVYMALVKAYKEKRKRVTIYSDSAYVVSAITKGWVRRWKNSQWLTKEGKPVKNQYIWEKMYKLLYEKNLVVNMVKIKGHAGDTLNEYVDCLAVEAKRRYIDDMEDEEKPC